MYGRGFVHLRCVHLPSLLLSLEHFDGHYFERPGSDKIKLGQQRETISPSILFVLLLYCTSICHVGHPRERVRRGPAGEGCPVAEGRSAVRHSRSAVSSWIGLNSVSHRSLASPVGAVSPLPSPSGVLLYRWLHRPCCPSQPPQRPFPVSDAVHLLISLLPETPSVYRFAQFQVSSSIVSVVYVLYRHTVDLISLPGFAV